MEWRAAHGGSSYLGVRPMASGTKAETFRRMEALFGLVPSFLKRMEDAGAILGISGLSGTWPHTGDGGPGSRGRTGAKVVCRYGPNVVRRPVGGDRRN